MATSPNVPEYSVAELAGAIKRTVESAFGLVRVRGEISGLKRAASGHVYLALKDMDAVIDGVMWRGNAQALRFKPEDGLEVIAVGRLTTYPGRSKYQIVIDRMEIAGLGALLAQLEARRKALAAEGLFAPERKRPLPYLPEHIGIVTSPTGAVIRDILHRLADRFPRRVTLWPVLVQGEGAAAQVANAIRGFNALAGDARPDLLIVARGGGSVEDLWAFNEEIVVRAAADSRIPLISAVGHETDTTLIDYASDRRAPTPTAAAEMAVPVRADLAEQLATLSLRIARGERRVRITARDRLNAARLPRPTSLVGPARQRLDELTERLPRALTLAVSRERTRLARVSALLRPATLAAGQARLSDRLARVADRLASATNARLERGRARLGRPAATPNLALLAGRLDAAASRVASAGDRLPRATAVRLNRCKALLARPSVTPNAALLGRQVAASRARLEAVARLAHSLSPDATLARGYAIVTDPAGKLLPTRAAAAAAGAVTIRFADGEAPALLDGASTPHKSAPKSSPPKPGQGSLFDA